MAFGKPNPPLALSFNPCYFFNMSKKYVNTGGMDAAVIYNDEVLPKAKLQGKKSTGKSIFYPLTPIYKVDRDPLSLSLSLSLI